MTEDFAGVVIFDGDCPVCSRSAGIIRRIDNVGVIAWTDDAAQAFLAEEFDEVPFVMVFADIEEQTIYVGEAAARELADRAGMPSMVSRLLEDHYHRVASALQHTVGSGVDPDPLDGEYELTAIEAYEAMRDTAMSVEGDLESDIEDAVEPS